MFSCPVDKSELLQFCNQNKIKVLAAIRIEGGEIANATSFETLFKIIGRYGGDSFLVPVGKNRKTILSDLIGHNDAAKIAELYGGEQVEIPTFNLIVSLYRKHTIHLLKSDGLNNSQIARKVGVTVRHVRAIFCEQRRKPAGGASLHQEGPHK